MKRKSLRLTDRKGGVGKWGTYCYVQQRRQLARRRDGIMMRFWARICAVQQRADVASQGSV